jgi:hypothetical protein
VDEARCVEEIIIIIIFKPLFESEADALKEFAKN